MAVAPSFNYGEWHGYIVENRPASAALDPEANKIVVAILSHDVLPSVSNDRENFVWINCKANTSFARLLKVYNDRYPTLGPFVFCHNGKRIGSIDKIGELSNDGAIILETILEDQYSSRISQEPLQSSSSWTVSQASSDRSRVALNPLSPNIRLSEQPAESKVMKSPNNQAQPVKDPKESEATKNTDIPRWGSNAVNYTPSTTKAPAWRADYDTESESEHHELSPAPAWREDSESESADPELSPGNPSLSDSDSTDGQESPSPIQAPHAPMELQAGSLANRPQPSPLAASQLPPVGPNGTAVTQEPLNTNAELPSKRLPDDFNVPFLKYLDHYYETYESVRSLSLTMLVDLVWTKWRNLSERSGEKVFFTRQAKQYLQAIDPIGDGYPEGLDDVKPVVPRENESSQQDSQRPMLDFRDDFGVVDGKSDVDEQLDTISNLDVHELIAEASLAELEILVSKGVKWLNRLKEPLQQHVEKSQDATNWITQIDNIKSLAVITRTVIGVVGNTGAGKSSVINAMLEEEQLLPTNTMRACTAVVTEISYNHEPGFAYRAEVEFLDENAWRAELKILFSDLVDEDGKLSREYNTPDSDAGIAYAKIRAVYPKKTREEIGQSDPEKMLKEVSHILGKTSKVSHNDSAIFYARLQKYIDSQEKVTAGQKKDDKKAPREMEYWPLIKVVRIYCRSAPLSTGAIIVDLPGVHDANAARAAVAEGYMKQCSGLWIVAPIIRAVDDKAAKNLLGQTFKRQLRMDGGFGQVSFICSKTDDISLIEATASLGLEEVNNPLWEESDRQVKLKEELEGRMQECTESRDALTEIMEGLDEEIDAWEQKQTELEEGDGTVFAPRNRKRKLKEPKDKNKTKRRKLNTNDDDAFIDHGSEPEAEQTDLKDEESEDSDASSQIPLTEEEISEKLSKLKEQKKSARQERTDFNRQIKDCKESIKACIKAAKDAEAMIAENCIKGRNAYSKEAIQQDFAAGIRELDQENAQEEDADNFNPEEDARDYDKIAKSLQVFCVSSRGYQQLSGRRTKDANVSGFTHVEQTEVPALQKHCEELTVVGRTQACNKFLLRISQIANALKLWASTDGTNAHLTPEQRERENRSLSKSLENLNNSFERLLKSTMNDLKEDFAMNIYDKYNVACEAAATQAVTTSMRWGTRPNHDNRSAGGYLWATYKAVCRRNGAYTNSTGPIDFNNQLAEPMMVQLIPGWERLFSRRVPATLTSLAPNVRNLLNIFHKDVAERARLSGIGIATLPLLEQQLDNHERMFREVATQLMTEINEHQRELNRQFIPSIAQAMEMAYLGCVAENGSGSFKRMQALMNNHTAAHRDSMFIDTCRAIKVGLNQILRTAEDELEEWTDNAFKDISRDYKATFHGTSLKPGQVLPRWELDMRKATLEVLRSLEHCLTMDDEDDSESENSNHDDEDNEAAAMQLDSEYGAVKMEEEDDLALNAGLDQSAIRGVDNNDEGSRAGE